MPRSQRPRKPFHARKHPDPAQNRPVSDSGRLVLVLSLRTRLLALSTAAAALGSTERGMLRQLIADLVVMLAAMRELAPLFESEQDVLAQVERCTASLACFVTAWKAARRPAASDIEQLEAAVDAYGSMLAETTGGEAGSALEKAHEQLLATGSRH